MTVADAKRLGSRLARQAVWIGSYNMLLQVLDGATGTYAALRTKWRKQRAGPLKGASVCACIFLNGSVLHRTSCRIYEKRPRVCRMAVKPGDKTCREIRRMMKEAVEDAG